MLLHAEVHEALCLAVTIEVREVSYFDSKGAQWKILPRRRPATLALIDKLSPELARRLNATSSDRVDRELAEEQLLGIALASLDGARFETVFESWNERPYLLGFEELFAERVPRSVPQMVSYRVRGFLEEALGLAVAPRPDALRAGASFEARGIAYGIDRIVRNGPRASALLRGQAKDRPTGTTCKDVLAVDPSAGLVTSGKRTVRQDLVVGNRIRFGVTLWKATLVTLARANEGPPPGP